MKNNSKAHTCSTDDYRMVFFVSVTDLLYTGQNGSNGFEMTMSYCNAFFISVMPAFIEFLDETTLIDSDSEKVIASTPEP